MNAVVWFDFNGVVQEEYLQAPFIRWKVHPAGPISVRGVDEHGEHLWTHLYTKVFKIDAGDVVEPKRSVTEKEADQ